MTFAGQKGIGDSSHPDKEDRMTHHDASDLPEPVKQWLASLTDEQRDMLKKAREKLDELGASDTVKAQVV